MPSSNGTRVSGLGRVCLPPAPYHSTAAASMPCVRCRGRGVSTLSNKLTGPVVEKAAMGGIVSTIQCGKRARGHPKWGYSILSPQTAYTELCQCPEPIPDGPFVWYWDAGGNLCRKLDCTGMVALMCYPQFSRYADTRILRLTTKAPVSDLNGGE